MPAKGNLRY